MKRFGAILFILSVCGVSLATGTLAPDLVQEMVEADLGEMLPVVVLMEEFPDQVELLGEVGRLNREQRRSHVVGLMKGLAERSQRSLHSVLALETREFDDLRILWGINGVALSATPDLIQRLASLQGVRRILHDRDIPMEEAMDGPTGGDASGPNPTAVVAGEVVAMGAQRVWDELGYTGDGVIVAVIDDGVHREHPDLADHIWTNLDEIPNNGIDDDGNGYIDDTWGWDYCGGDNDPNRGSHGTNVAGQVAGDGTDGTVTGMAPDAELMALATCAGPSAWWQAADYAIDNGAQVITQSLSFKWPSRPDYEAFRRQTDTELAAGVIHINSTGNTGTSSDPVPYNVATPGNSPPPWMHPDQAPGGVSSVIGSANINWGTDNIASTSPYGPSAWEDIQAVTDPDYPHSISPDYRDYPHEGGGQQGLLKPDLAAYGDNTVTTCPGSGGYCGFSGTSSATPHIAGVVALMLSSNLEASPAFITEALFLNAQPRGVPGKNNRYGAGLVQAYESVVAVESGVLYESHTIDDAAGGNGNGVMDPGERIVMPVTVLNSTSDTTFDDVVAILSTTSPGVTIHNRYVTYPVLGPLLSAANSGPNFSFTVDPATCSSQVSFDLELRFAGKVRRSVIYVRVGNEQSGDFLYDDFESPGGWTSDPGTGSDGEWVREDPIGVLDTFGVLANPEDDTTVDPGAACWITGNGEQNGKKDENNNDVDGGEVILLSPPFGEAHALSMNLYYDRWYYERATSSDSFRSEVSNDGGATWTEMEWLISTTSGWGSFFVNLATFVPLSDDMRVRFLVRDALEDSTVEGAVDEVRISGRWVTCNDFTQPSALPPNPVGDTLLVDSDPAGHSALSWEAPPIDASHDAATLYRVYRALSPAGPFVEAGSATVPSWFDVDATTAVEPYYYRVQAENAGGGE